MLFKSDIIHAGSTEYSSAFSDNSQPASQNSSPDNSNEDDYFEQTRQGDNQSGGSKDFKAQPAPIKSSHSGGSNCKQSKLNMTSWNFSNEDVFEFQGKRRKWDKCVLAIVNTRLGMKKVPEETYPEITKLFNIPQMIGIIGGKSKFGLYFVGAQKDNLILLDPHFNQETVMNEEEIKHNRDTYR